MPVNIMTLIQNDIVSSLKYIITYPNLLFVMYTRGTYVMINIITNHSQFLTFYNFPITKGYQLLIQLII